MVPWHFLMVNNCLRCGAPFTWVAGPQHHCSFECRFWSKIAVLGPDECWEWLGARDKDGYGLVRTPWQALARANRVALILSGVPLLPGQQSTHECDTPPCCNPAHLRPDSAAGNNAERARRGRNGIRIVTAERRLEIGKRSRGEANVFAKLTEDAVREIRKLAGVGALQDSLASRFAVSQGTISAVILRKVWKHIQ
jgi:hypothetical protein